MKQLGNYGKAGTLVLVRTLGKISAYSVCAREAAKLGAVSSAAHAVCFALGRRDDATLRGRGRRNPNVTRARVLRRESTNLRRSHRILRLGLATGLGCSSLLATTTYLNRHNVVAGLTTDPKVRAACLGVFPLVMLCQALKGLAYPVNGC